MGNVYMPIAHDILPWWRAEERKKKKEKKGSSKNPSSRCVYLPRVPTLYADTALHTAIYYIAPPVGIHFHPVICLCSYHVDFMLGAFAISPSHSGPSFITRGQFPFRTFNLKYLYELNAIIIFHLDNKWPNSVFIFSLNWPHNYIAAIYV